MAALAALTLTAGVAAPAIGETATPATPLGEVATGGEAEAESRLPQETAPDSDASEASTEAPDSGQLGETAVAPEPSAPSTSVPAAAERAVASAVALAVGDGTLSVTLTQVTGTEPFDGDDAAGNDSSPTNDVVRTNDSVTYTVGLRVEGADQTSPTMTFVLPKGEELLSLPPFCVIGSSVTPGTLPAPAIPVTMTSWEALPQQTVTCVVEDRAAGSSLDYKFVSKVRPEVPNGTVLGPIAVSATSTEVTEPAVSGPVSHSVSAAANFDVSKRTRSGSDNAGPFYQNYRICSFDAARLCTRMEFPLTMEAPAGGKGITPLASPVVVTEDLRPDAFFGAGTTVSPAWLAAGPDALERYAPRLTMCAPGYAMNLYGEIPDPSVRAGNSAASAVRDSGTITCAQPALGTPVDIAFTGADTTGYTVPTLTSGTAPLPADSGYVLSTVVVIEVPFDAVRDLGEEIDDSYTLNWRNHYSQVQANAIDGNPNQGERPENNVRTGTTKFDGGSGSFSLGKGFSGVTNAPGNTPTGQFTSWEFQGPPGSSSWRDGNTVVLPGQTVLSNLTVSHDILPMSGAEFSRTFVSCDVWDSTKLAMPVSFDLPATTQTRVQFASNGSPAWVSSVIQDSWWASADGLDNLKIEYGYTADPGSAEKSACNTGTWATSPGAVPGASVVDGNWQGVNRVRFAFSDEGGTTGTQITVNFSIAMRVLASAGPNGTVIPNFASLQTKAGAHSLDEAVAAPDTTHNSSYVPATNAGNQGDRLVVGQASARIKKFVRNPTSGEFQSSGAPQYTAGSAVAYRLTPTLTADGSASGLTQNVTVEDCLPPYQQFVSSTRESGAAITPVVVQSGSPAGAEVTCAATQTYVKWDLGSQEINKVIDPIVYEVEITATARNGVYTNTAVIAATGDPTGVRARTSTAQIQLVVPTGIKISKTVDKPVIEVNPSSVSNPRTLTWTVAFANIDAPANVENVDIVDVLPANGLNGNDYQGSLVLESVTPTAGDGIAVLYTRAPSASLSSDPDHASNTASGATVWCDAISGDVVSGSGSAADCPQTSSEVTGLRFQRPGAFTPEQDFAVAITMTPVGNAQGDLYRNITSGRVDGVSQGVGPAIRTVAVVSSSIGDRVWFDANADGLQSEGESGVAGVPVTLTGTDVDGNAVTLATVTGADGSYLFADLASGTYVVTFDEAWVKANHYDFTQRYQGEDAGIDSDADLATGASGEIVLGIDADRPDVDAGLVQPVGSLVVVKQLTGAGVALAGDTFAFDVVCTSRGVEVYSGEVELTRSGEESELTSEPITGLPVGAECMVTETATGGADEVPAPVTVTITRDVQVSPVLAVVVNEFSAGTISVSKVLDGPYADHADVVDREFTLLVTCEIEIDVEGEPQLGTLVSQSVTLRGGETLTLVDAEGIEVLLPLGATCFVEETDAGGADETTIEHGSFETGAVVTGNPEELQELTVSAVNTFTTDPNPPVTPPTTPPVTPPTTPPVTPPTTPAVTPPTTALPHTGADVLGFAGIAALLVAGGLAALVVRRRRAAVQD
ncbi:hypothetical protein C8046_06185 [Serinibacter arcticus]|uniref:Uncharacterized protein n=1 Tax=Serinibacter arcticus TaxID=1655435 RepID=A0A2U1ZTJ4_9MICO|nr:SdrD B-like domain-containing protein [Serinibacter arcticus]PWD50308.1 hypothetical protein C8046_06185 [Serinibacter arcticus]